MASNQLHIVKTAVWKGVALPLEKGATFDPGGIKNNAVVFAYQTFRSQEGVSSKLSGNIPFAKGMKLSDIIGDMSEGELQVETDAGGTYVVPDAFLTDPPGIGGDGKRKVEWMGSAAQEVS